MKKLFLTIFILISTQLFASNWLRGEKLIIQSSKVTANQTDFPVMIDSSNVNLEIFTLAKSDGGDIRITTSNVAPDDVGAAEVPVDIERFNPADSTMIIWFKIASLSSIVDGDIWIWYNNSSATLPAATATYGSQNVWNSNHKAVYHLHEGDATTTDFYKDKTSNAKHATLIDASGGTAQINGKVGKSLDFEGDADYLSIPNSFGIDGSSNYSISFWLRMDAFPAILGWQTADVVIDLSGESNFLITFADGTSNVDRLGVRRHNSTSGWLTAVESNRLSINIWYFFVLTYNSTSGYILYQDATNVSTNIDTDTYSTGTDQNKLAGNTGGTDRYMDGKLDQIAFFSTTLSSSWVSTTYNNQNSPSTFIIESAPFDVNPAASTAKFRRRRKIIR